MDRELGRPIRIRCEARVLRGAPELWRPQPVTRGQPLSLSVWNRKAPADRDELRPPSASTKLFAIDQNQNINSRFSPLKSERRLRVSCATAFTCVLALSILIGFGWPLIPAPRGRSFVPPARQNVYCLQGRTWAHPGNCQFSTYDQCMASASGTSLLRDESDLRIPVTRRTTAPMRDRQASSRHQSLLI
ncbi:DUF3551 domain-containing protein [Bradyrhizobium sp. WSM1417]|uniref:DUF3551 domain-containing protein n=1 Tax=Bradyrhizobium sp. WSM1417 TaxID=754500 RepID=UPI0035278387